MNITATVQQCVALAQSQALANANFTEPGMTIKIAQAMAAAQTVAEPYGRQRRRILEEYGKVDENGTLMTQPDGSLVYKDPKKRQELEDRIQAELDATTEIVVPEMTMDQVKWEGMTPAGVLPLLPFLKA